MPGTANKLHATDLPEDVEMLRELVRELVEENKQLSHRLQLLLRQRFGQSAERIDRAQLELFAKEILDSKGKAEVPDDEGATVIREHRRNGRRKLGRDLPRIRIEHDVPESERACSACGEMRTRIGEEISEQLE